MAYLNAYEMMLQDEQTSFLEEHAAHTLNNSEETVHQVVHVLDRISVRVGAGNAFAGEGLDSMVVVAVESRTAIVGGTVDVVGGGKMLLGIAGKGQASTGEMTEDGMLPACMAADESAEAFAVADESPGGMAVGGYETGFAATVNSNDFVDKSKDSGMSHNDVVAEMSLAPLSYLLQKT